PRRMLSPNPTLAVEREGADLLVEVRNRKFTTQLDQQTGQANRYLRGTPSCRLSPPLTIQSSLRASLLLRMETSPRCGSFESPTHRRPRSLSGTSRGTSRSNSP